MVLAEARHCWGGLLPFARVSKPPSNARLDTSFNDISKIGECEFTLISEMNSQLIIHHPYRSMAELRRALKENLSLANYARFTPQDIAILTDKGCNSAEDLARMDHRALEAPPGKPLPKSLIKLLLRAFNKEANQTRKVERKSASPLLCSAQMNQIISGPSLYRIHLHCLI